MNRVEFFESESVFALQEVINVWCEEKDLDPLSVSIMHDSSNYIAAVVVKERE